jgi:uncharacterized protein (TIGR03437 family)
MWISQGYFWHQECNNVAVLAKSLVCLALLSAFSGLAQTPGFLLGVDYSEWTAQNTRQIATDAAGALYLLADSNNDATGTQSAVIKLSPDGQTILWASTLGFWTATMAVDPTGAVYVAPTVLQSWPNPPTFQPIQVVKLDAQSGAVLWTASAGFSGYGTESSLAVDSSGRAWVAGTNGSNGYVARLNAEGTAVELAVQSPQYSSPSLLTLDGAGSAFFVLAPGSFPGVSSIGKIAANGVLSLYAQVNGDVTALFVDSSDNGTVFETQGGAPVTQDELLRLNASGTVVSTITFTENALSGRLALLTVDAAGNAYIGGYNAGYVHGVKNALTGCGSNWLKVVAPDGSVLQDTYIPGAENDKQYQDFKLMAPGPGGTFFLVAASDPNNPVERQGPYEAYPGGLFLQHLSQNPQAQTYPLACQANAGSYQITAVSPGEILALFGSGLGPQQGVQTTATPQTPYPTQAAGVQVTFDGNPAPLLWVQDSQINVIAPWSLTPGHKTEICVNNNGAKTNCQTWPVWESSPGVFTADGYYAVALNQDGTLNSAQNPAKVGSTVTIFVTGMGPLTPTPADGSLIGSSLPLDVLPVSVTSVEGGIFPTGVSPVTVKYAGPAQGLVAGLNEVSFIVNGLMGLGLCSGSFCTAFAIH